MDSTNGKASKSGDVVVVMSGEVSTQHVSPTALSPVSCPTPEIVRLSTSPNRPPRIITTATDTLTRRKSLARAVLLRHKTRFGEQSVPLDSQLIEEISSMIEERTDQTAFSPNITSNQSSPINKMTTNCSILKEKMQGEEEDENEPICKKVSNRRKSKYERVKVKVLLQWAVFFCILGCFLASMTLHRLQQHTFWRLELWKWFLLVLVTFFGMLVTKWSIRFLIFLIECNFLFRKKVLYFVHGLKESVQVFIWMALVFLIWVLLFNHGPDRTANTSRILDYITWTAASLLIGSFLWLLKTLLLNILASSFHLNRFFDRIQVSIFHQYTLQRLSGPPVMESAQTIGRTTSTNHLSFRIKREGKEGTEEEVVDMNRLYRLKQEKVSAWTMKELVDVISSSGLSIISNAIDENYYEEGDELTEKEITSEMEAIAAACLIFKNIAHTDYRYIYEDDLRRFMIKEEVDLVFPMLGGSGMGQINKQALIDWVVKSYKGRKALAHALTDTRTVVKQLNKLISGVLVVVTIILWLCLMGFATTKVLVVVSSQLLIAGFVFKNICKSIFEAIVFVFVMHPFDVGDRCVIDGVQMIVEEMNILSTVFLRYDREMIYYPNSVLATKPISNFYRSPNMGDLMEFSIDFTTPVEKIGALKDKIKIYLENNSQHWHPDHNVVVREIEDCNKIKMAFYFNHTMNFQEFHEMLRRRSELVIELKKLFDELGIVYTLPPQELRLVETRNG